jgi:hypothetical protein
MHIYGHTVPRTKRAAAAAGGVIVPPNVGLIGGAFEFLIVSPNTWESFSFDAGTTFSTTYSSLDGDSASPTWRFNIFSSRTGTGVDVAQADVLIRLQTLTGFQARSPEANTLCKYAITKT